MGTESTPTRGAGVQMIPSGKTNVMRVLEQHKIDYASYTYGDGSTALSGTEVRSG